MNLNVLLLSSVTQRATPLLLLLLLVAAAAEGPCDIYDAAPEGTPCIAAHSTVRALYAAYAGPLYQVKRSTDNRTKDVAPISAGGLADSASQDAFCGADHCVSRVRRVFKDWCIYGRRCFCAGRAGGASVSLQRRDAAGPCRQQHCRSDGATNS